MGFYVNPPADGFAEVLADGQYVDKSGLIAYMNGVLGTSRKLITSTRPRRFGKSFAAKMLAAYYSKGADARPLFEKLKIAGSGDESRYEEHHEEVRGEFIRAVKEGQRPELAKAVKISDELLRATLAKDETAVARMIEAAHFAETAPQNYNDEQALRHVVIMAYLTSIDHYLKFEELASGRGYCDILFLPRPTSGKPALLVELKWDKSADKAITQIVDKQYPEIIKKFGYEGKLLLIGLNYSTMVS